VKSEKTHVGVIGAGYWGRKHVEEYTAIGAKVTVADVSEETLEYCEKNYGANITKNYRDLLVDKNIVGVNICTPNATHYSIGKEFLEAGKHVLVEKPLSMNAEEARELVDIAKDNNLVLAVGHIFRFNNAINKIKEMIENKELGEIRIVKLKWTNMERLFEDRDVIFDLAPHAFDIINHLLGQDPDEISCVGGAYRRSKDPEAVFINGRANKTIVNIELSWLTPPKTRQVVIVGASKTLVVNATAQVIEVIEPNGKKYTLETIPNNTIRAELERFIENMKTPTRIITEAHGEIGLKSIKMIELVLRALEEKTTLRLDWR